MSGGEPILRAENLTKHFPSSDGFLDRLLGNRQWVKAVDGVDIEVHEQETVGVVGESGCGKTTLGRSLLQLVEPTEGSVYYRGDDLTALSERELRERRKDLQYIFQNPFASLNPRFTVADIIGEPLDIHDIADGDERQERVYELLETVGLDPSHANRYPHEFSGGQRQRIGIARALALEPELIVCDEPVSALDVSVQAQIINLLEDLQAEFGLSYVFIAHDLSVVEHIADRIAVMYLGNIVEFGTTEEVFSEPYHPYTESLLSAIPEPDPLWEGDRIVLKGDVPSPTNPPEGCRFHTRCPRIVQPESMALEQSAWLAIVRLWTDIRQRAAATEVVSAETDPDTFDIKTVDVDEVLREKYGLPSRLSDADAEAAFESVVEAIASDDLEAAEERLGAAFETPCMTDVPELDGEGTHPIACHLHHDEYPDIPAGELPEDFGESAGDD